MFYIKDESDVLVLKPHEREEREERWTAGGRGGQRKERKKKRKKKAKNELRSPFVFPNLKEQ